MTTTGTHSVCQDHLLDKLGPFMKNMLRKWIALAVLVSATLLWHLLPMKRLGKIEFSAATAIIEDLAFGKITSVSIFYLPFEALTSLPLSPEALMGTALVHRKFPIDRQLEASLIMALCESDATPSIVSPDLRWGAQLLDSEGQVVHSIFLSGGGWPTQGRSGVIDGGVVELNHSLAGWFDQSFGHLVHAERMRRVASR